MQSAKRRFFLLAALLLLSGVAQAGQGLTRAEVKHYLQTSIEVADLQNDFKANADKYDNVVQAFYRARERLVKERGYADGAAFDRMKMRIWAAYNNMDEYQQIEQRIRERQDKANGERNDSATGMQPKRHDQLGEAEKRRRMLDNIDKLPISEEQKRIMLAQLETMPERSEQQRQIAQRRQQADKRRVEYEEVQSAHERQRMAQLEQNRADWPAVRHYRETIDALSDWYNGNTDKRPLVK